jgi:hypothetical protein
LQSNDKIEPQITVLLKLTFSPSHKKRVSAFSAGKREREEVAVINGGDPNCLTRNPEVK